MAYMEPTIIDTSSGKFRITRETYVGKQFWSAKRGEWLHFTEWRNRSTFRSREAAELELKRITLGITPDVPKKAVRSH